MILNLTFTIDTDNLDPSYQCDKSEGKDAIVEVLQNIFWTLQEPLKAIPIQKLELLKDRAEGRLAKEDYDRFDERFLNEDAFWKEFFRQPVKISGHFDEKIKFELKDREIVYEKC